MFEIILNEDFWFLQSINTNPQLFEYPVRFFWAVVRRRFVFDGAGIDFVKTRMSI